MTTWDDYGPAEFDKRRMPRGHKTPPAAQAGLFVIAATPKPVKTEPVVNDPDQLDMFGEAGQ